MNLCDFAPEYIRAIQPYQPGKPISELVRELGLDEHNVIKLASNENPLGTSPLAREAMINALNQISLYPDGSGFELKAAISQRYSVNTDQIILGNGSNDILDLAARVFLKPGAAAVYSQHAFAVYPLVVQTIGANGISVPARDYGHDLAAMLDAVTPETRIVFIASPNNPTGTLSEVDDLLRFLERVSRDVLVVLDEAYNEYLPEANKRNSISWLKRFPNLIITRTFSKAYGLAGVRVGFGLAHTDVADLMNRVRQPFNVNSIGLAGALAALQDTEFVERSYALNRTGMLHLTDGLRQLGIEYIPSFGNFLSFRVEGDVANTKKVYQSLLQQGVIVRPLGIYEMPQHLRVTIGLESENQKFLKSLERAIGELA
ncbi:histidinol-phosphate aminotransferase [Nitrosomonas cryotolerans]|uniref:Histidinol-phosphate aminotransferase n=1 Tax=Nitrosomonas cryotolerans ATCC 49181 TaxID=1131553 RepID=A0A1N6HI07_9PROT|nr:histidinol-phosphate transaminase [Nitrosomonas cryotolerans]SFP65480.1 histidinol-phosphate aminotransferase [Nitrosomonas cryotolerans]SIO19392.1 histidinol-phosphate aminotransferase [Nitrosomonas cryotolerans ATCC 49181]